MRSLLAESRIACTQDICGSSCPVRALLLPDALQYPPTSCASALCGTFLVRVCGSTIYEVNGESVVENQCRIDWSCNFQLLALGPSVIILIGDLSGTAGHYLEYT